MSISIRMPPEQEQLAKSYAKVKGMTLSDAIEDEYDVSVADERMAEIESGKEKKLSWEEVQKNNGLL